MTDQLTYENIDQLQLTQLTRPAGWQLSFRSSNVGQNHQLYINGRLADFSDTPSQRTFEIHATDFPQELAVAAVSGRYRTAELYSELPSEAQNPPWVLRRKIVRDILHQPGDKIAVFHDSASGTLSETPSIEREIWPVSQPHWGFGMCMFGLGGFGIDGVSSPGFGGGAFGIGPFGLNAELMEISLAVCSDGAHAVAHRVISGEGGVSSTQTDQLEAAPPPTPTTGLSVTAYEPQKNHLTLQLQIQ